MRRLVVGVDDFGESARRQHTSGAGMTDDGVVAVRGVDVAVPVGSVFVTAAAGGQPMPLDSEQPHHVG
ncbi:hypothetical protein [Nocardia nepalensis]|uniref:hypothetical protein n=1 Tax=Nocardia nepalensis TaxID=3375448 RepID=UPI003B67C55B